MATKHTSLIAQIHSCLRYTAAAGERRFRLPLLLAATAAVLLAPISVAQTPVVLPNTISTVAGGGTTPAKNAACATGSPFTATDAFGDGCPATLVSLGNSLYGEGTDPYGNIFVLDTTNEIIHRIDARSGIMTLAAGTATTVGCSGQADKYGDNCLATTQTGSFNNPRGLTVDPYGNLIISGYSEDLIQIVCNAVSPLCTAGQVGYMRILAGYSASSSASGTATAGTTAGTAGDGTPTVGTSTTGVDQPRGAAADIFGNVYIADTANLRFRVVLGPASYNGVTNPLTAVIGLDSTYNNGTTIVPTAGKIYPILGGFTAVTAGNFCNGSSGTNSLDAFSDGCPFYNSAISSSNSSDYGVAITPSGDAVMSDAGNKLIRVLYMGGTQMGNLIALENPGVTPVVGSVYVLAGGGTHGISTTPLLASSLILNTATRVTLDSLGNIYLGETTADVAFIDINTGFGRVLFANGTACSAKTDSVGDGCPAGQSTFGVNSSTLSISIDNIGNLYIADSIDSRVRKVSASALMPMIVGTTATQNIVVHEPAGVTSVTAALSTASPDVAIALASCTTNTDNTLDCPITATLTPSSSNVRATALVVTPSGSLTTPTVFPVAGLATGSALVADGVTSSSTGAVLPTASLGTFAPLTVAVDGSNNVYSVNNTNRDFNVYVAAGATTTQLSSTAPTGTSQIAVDSDGNIYAVGSGAATITKLTVTGAQSSSSAPPAYSAGTVSYTPPTTPAKPQGIVVDANANIYVSDGANGAVYKFSQSATYESMQTVASGFSNPTLIALDNLGNLYVYDAGATTVFKVAYSGTKSTFLASVTATGLSTDAAGDVYIQTATGVTEYPVSGAATTVYSGGTTPNGIALDGSGNLYIADAGNAGILQVQRTAVAYNFGTGSSSSPTLTGTLTDAGNQAVTGSNTVTNTTNFAVVGGSSNPCNFSSSILGAQAIGNACSFSATFVGNGAGTVSDVLTYLPASTTGSLTLSGTLQGSAVATTTTIGNETPANPSYSPSGTEVTFTVTVAPASGSTAPGGTVAVTVDSTITHPALTANGINGVATVTVSGLIAGNHTISAIYSTNGTFTGSNSGTPTAFSVAQDTTTASWTPGVTSVPYSSAIGTAALNAAATFNSATVPGNFVYTANGNEVNAATYLAVGTYTLSATFYPIDNVDYTTATVSGGTFTVTKASTTAAVGATQNLVASDGTGNYSSVQAAINALPGSGGSIYIKPGTYSGFLTVVGPNVALRGLGGDPTQVILTHEAGAFGSTYPYTGEFTAANESNGDQLPTGSTVSTGDPGSATLFVARGVNTAISSATTTPIGFYAENLSLINGYNTDTATTTTTYETAANGTCTVSAGPAQTYSYLFNNQIQCASQALAIWIESDQAVLNNVYTTSLQDTVYSGAISTGGGNAARQYWFRGKITGAVDFMFGDAAAVFDHTSIYTVWHGTTATGTETIQAQNKAQQTGGSNDYLSGYVMNSNIFTSQSTGMTNLYFGRPYGTYSTSILLNSSIDQVNAVGYIPFSPPLLNMATYAEYNDHLYTDPSTGSPDANGVIYLGAGGNTGSGVTSTRETTSTNPGTLEVASSGFQANYPSLANTTLSPAEAQQYYTMAFLGQTVPLSTYNTVLNWNPIAAMATNVNAFVPSGSSASVAVGSSVTILLRPQTPGLGAVTNGVYTIPTGTYTLTDTVSGTPTTLASGTLDASGEAYFTSSSLSMGTHNLTWTYSGDSNFSGSTTVSAYALTVNPIATTTALSANVNPIGYGGSASITATVTPASGATAPSGSVTLTTDGTTTQTASLSSGTVTFIVNGLSGGSHSFSASYGGAATFAASSTPSNLPFTVTPATLTVTAMCNNRVYGQVNSCAASVAGYQYSDNAAIVFTGTPTGTSTAARNTLPGTYSATPLASSLTLTPYGTANYQLSLVNSTFSVTGGAAQAILFSPLPNFAHGASYQLTARATSGLPVSYSVTTGNASVSGSTLTVTGTGAVTVQASQSVDPTGSYSVATPMSRSFTAQ